MWSFNTQNMLLLPAFGEEKHSTKQPADKPQFIGPSLKFTMILKQKIRKSRSKDSTKKALSWDNYCGKPATSRPNIMPAIIERKLYLPMRVVLLSREQCFPVRALISWEAKCVEITRCTPAAGRLMRQAKFYPAAVWGEAEGTVSLPLSSQWHRRGKVSVKVSGCRIGSGWQLRKYMVAAS